MSEPGAPQTTMTKSPRWMRYALIVSVAVNMLIVGFAVGAMISHRGPHGRGTGLERFARELPADKRDAVTAILAERGKELEPLREEIGRARRAAGDALVAPTFERAAYSAAEQRLLAALARYREARFAVMPDIAEKLDQAERKMLVEAIARRGRRWRPRGDE